VQLDIVRAYKHIPQSVLSQPAIPAPSSLVSIHGATSAGGSMERTSVGFMSLKSSEQSNDQLVDKHVKPAPLEIGHSVTTGSHCHGSHSTEADVLQRDPYPAHTPGSSASADSSVNLSRFAFVPVIVFFFCMHCSPSHDSLARIT
jgi:hypothetical protein